MQGGQLHVYKTIKAPCGHDDTGLFGLVINQEELLAVSCYWCKKIRLLNLETEQVTEAYSDEKVECMSHGMEGRVFVESSGDKVIELDYSSSRFIHKNTIQIGLAACTALCYLSTHDYVVVSGVKSHGDPGEIWAISCEDGEVVWRVQGKVEGKKINPWGLLLFGGAVLVADYCNNRILVLDPSHGSCIKTIQPPGFRYIYNLGLYNTQIVMLHGFPRREISFFNVK